MSVHRHTSQIVNSLEHYIREYLKDSETDVLNILQDHGVVSDNAIYVWQVANSGDAIRWIERNPQYFRRGLVKSKKRPTEKSTQGQHRGGFEKTSPARF